MSETDDFKSQVVPAKRRSKFDPHLDGILELQRDGYSLEQICEWLWQKFQIGDQEKKAPSSKQVLSAYLQRRKEQGVATPFPSAPSLAGKVTAPNLQQPLASEEVAPSPEGSLQSVADALDAEKRQQRANSYITDTNTSLIIGRKKS